MRCIDVNDCHNDRSCARTAMQWLSMHSVLIEIHSSTSLLEICPSPCSLSAGKQAAMSVRLRVEQDDGASPAHKKVRLSLPAALARVGQKSPVGTAAQTATPDLFDATPTEATGVAVGRRKSSRSRVFSQRSSGGCELCLSLTELCQA